MNVGRFTFVTVECDVDRKDWSVDLLICLQSAKERR